MRIKLGLGFFLLIIALAVFAPFVSPHNPMKTDLNQRLQGMSPDYPLGTDALGRCVLSRLIFACRVTPMFALLVVFFSMIVGSTAGLVSGYFGGLVDYLLGGVVEGVLIFPSLGLALVLAAFLGPSIFTMAVALGLVHWAEYARIVRNTTLGLKEMDFILAARALGASRTRIIFHHVLPNSLGPILVMAAFSMAWSILAFSGLSFLGLGASPGTPEWGLMTNEGRAFLRTAPRLVTAPGLTIMLTVVMINMLGDALRDYFSGSMGNP